jgi:hypothetical protein
MLSIKTDSKAAPVADRPCPLWIAEFILSLAMPAGTLLERQDGRKAEGRSHTLFCLSYCGSQAEVKFAGFGTAFCGRGQFGVEPGAVGAGPYPAML